MPRAAIAKRIFAAPDKVARRRILGRELPRILDDCVATLDQCVRPDTRYAVVFARKAVVAACAGHIEAAQALVANTLDTTMRGSFDESERVRYTSHNLDTARDELARDELDDLTVRRFMVLVPVWHAYSRYRPGQVDPIPWPFNRHVNAHGVTSRPSSAGPTWPRGSCS